MGHSESTAYRDCLNMRAILTAPLRFQLLSNVMASQLPIFIEHTYTQGHIPTVEHEDDYFKHKNEISHEYSTIRIWLAFSSPKNKTVSNSVEMELVHS